MGLRMQLLFIIIAVVAGYGMTLLCYIKGGFALQPGLFLAKLFREARGGESLLVPFEVINTTIYSIVIYTVLWLTKRRRKHAF
jgi:hypothetical protein